VYSPARVEFGVIARSGNPQNLLLLHNVNPRT
jgi:hypothetical protein